MSSEIENNVANGQIILAVASGNKTLTQINRALHKSPATIYEQATALQKAGWLKRENKDFSLNKGKFLDYCSKKPFSINRKVLNNSFQIWIDLFVSSGVDAITTTTINSLCHYLKMNAEVLPMIEKNIMPQLTKLLSKEFERRQKIEKQK